MTGLVVEEKEMGEEDGEGKAQTMTRKQGF